MNASTRKAIAVAYGVVCHSVFALAIAGAVVGFWDGLQFGHGQLTGPKAWLADLVLALQFPLLHSFLLGGRGRRVLAMLAPAELGRDLSSTTFATFGSLQLLGTVWLWSPSREVLFQPHGAALAVHALIYVASWGFLLKALYDAGLDKQTGLVGWLSVVRGRRPDFGRFPERGLFRACRQPVYLAFALLLWTGPCWTPDKLLLGAVWSSYCFLGPRLKERRYLAWFGPSFQDYRARVPYFFPRIRS